MFQQGDCLVMPTTIPLEAKKRDGNVLAEGEATGHAHRIQCPTGVQSELLELENKLFLRILGGNASVVHEEHNPITVPVGEYEINRVKEYDHFLEEARAVAD